MLKFGQLVDIERLQSFGVNKVAEEMAAKLELDDVARRKELAQCDAEIEKLKLRLTEVTRENTAKLQELIACTEEMRDFERGLDKELASVVCF